MPHRFFIFAVVFAFIASAAIASAQAPVADDFFGPGTVVGSGIARVMEAVNLTADQQAALKNIVNARKDDVLAARMRGDQAAFGNLLRDAIVEAAAVLTPAQREIARGEIHKALAEQGVSMPLLESFFHSAP